MPTRETTVVDAVVAAIRAANIAGVGTRVYEERADALSVVDTPAINVRRLGSEPEDADLLGLEILHTLRVAVDVIVREGATDPPTKVADPIVASLHRTVMQSSTIAAVTLAVVPGAHRYAREASGDGVLLRRSAEYLFQFRTSMADLEVVP